ncbi:MAG: hypothetical protein AB7O52_06485 [Planctomycetota bacterium]
MKSKSTPTLAVPNGTKSPPSKPEPASPAVSAQAATSPWRDKILIASFLGYFAMLGGFWWAYVARTDFEVDQRVRDERHGRLATNAETQALKVTVFDEIAPPGSDVDVRVKFENDGPGPINRDQKNLRVVVGLERGADNVTVEALTDDDGVARGRLSAPRETGQYRLFAHAKEQHDYAPRAVRVPPALFVYPVDRPLLICDLDGTVTAEESLDVMSVTPRQDAARVLTALAAKYSLVYLTARDEGLLDRSRDWLDQHGFPRAPVLCRDWTVTNLKQQAKAKIGAIEGLQARFSKLAWGIGNAKSDRAAYTAARLPHIIIQGSGDETQDGVRSVGVSQWAEVEKIIEGQP